MLKNIKTSAYTLMEMSIVLVIIGLIMGAVSVSSSFINQAQLKAVISEVQTFKAAMSTFQLRYGMWPGDLTNASSYWPTCDATKTNCNGNGDGRVTYAGNGTTTVEGLRAWQQLTASGILQGSYTGVATTTNQTDIGINGPASKYPNAGYSIVDWGTGSAGNVFDFGSFSGGGAPGGSIIPSVDLYSIDLKIDDGMPRIGAVWALNGGCFSSNTSYIFTSNPLCTCTFMFQQ